MAATRGAYCVAPVEEPARECSVKVLRLHPSHSACIPLAAKRVRMHKHWNAKALRLRGSNWAGVLRTRRRKVSGCKGSLLPYTHRRRARKLMHSTLVGTVLDEFSTQSVASLSCNAFEILRLQPLRPGTAATGALATSKASIKTNQPSPLNGRRFAQHFAQNAARGCQNRCPDTRRKMRKLSDAKALA
jgi:hypothetical protein